MIRTNQFQTQTSRIQRQSKLVLITSVVAVLSACGGSSDPAVSAALGNQSAAEVEVVMAAKPENYVPESITPVASDVHGGGTSAADMGDAAPEQGPRSLASVTSAAWVQCATENSTCQFTGTRDVLYGTATKTVKKSLTGPVQCSNSVFGDPAPGYVKTCSLWVSSTTTTPTTPTTTAPAPAPAPSTGARDPLKQPFASNSIWNMPIGSGAVYVPANLSANPGNNIWAKMPGIDMEKIILTPTAPLVNINYSNAGWTGKNRCSATGGLLMQVPMPSSYVVPHTTLNSSATFLMPDRRTLVQTQPLARCTAGGAATSMAKFANVDLYGPGITGAHGGSGLSAIGGSIRLGELRPGSTTGPRHALKINVYAKEALYKCTTRSACSRWPAVTSDSYAVGWYGSANGNSNTAMKMGALLAIPASTSIASLGLETEPAKQLAWTLQNYGGYIVDDTYAPGFDFNAEEGPNGSKKTEFRADWGFDMEQKVAGNTPWVRDIQRLAKALYVVNNNSATSIGGGGTPRQPLAPALQ